MASLWAPPASCQKRSVFPMSHTKNLAAPGPAPFSNFWPFRLSFPLIFAFWVFISFHFSLVGLHFLASWPRGPSFPFILALWSCGPAFSSFPCILASGFLGHFLTFVKRFLFLSTALPTFRGVTSCHDLWDGQPRPTHVERCCRGVPSPGPRLTQGGVFLSAPCRLAMSSMASLTGNNSICGVVAFCPGVDVENIQA